MVKLLAECNSTNCLGQVTDLIHDNWFSVKDVRLDPESRTVHVPFSRVDEGSGREVQAELQICNAESFQCEDAQKIQRYDFNELAFYPEKRLLEIRTGIPTKFDVKVEGLLVKVLSSLS